MDAKPKPRPKRSGPASPPVTFVELPPTATQGGALELVLRGAERVVRVPVDFDAVALGRLLDMLERRA